MKKLVDFIVKNRIYIIVFTLIVTVLFSFLLPKVKINYDMSKYLPDDTGVYKGLNIMNDEFGLIGSVRILVRDIKESDSVNIYERLSNIKGIKTIDFSNEDFKDNKALYSLIINSSDFSIETKNTINDIRSELEDYDYSIAGSSVNPDVLNTTMKKDMPVFGIIAVSLIFIILLLISTSWIEPILFLFISGVSILLNYGSNIMFDNVSFITFTIAALLQLALSMDYSIILLDQYHHESIDNDSESAMKKALLKSIRSISASSLTTIFGLLAMIFMSFKIGKDLGIVLAKGITINVLVVFFVLPALILLFDKILKKTKKKSIKIPYKIQTRIGIKGRNIITYIFIILVIISFIVQNKLELKYSFPNVNNDQNIIEKEYGKDNQFIILYKNDIEKDKLNNILSYLNTYTLNDKVVINSVMDYSNTSGVMLGASEFSGMTGVNKNLVSNIYKAYNTANKTNNGEIELIKLIKFINESILKNPSYSKLIDENARVLFASIHKELSESENLLKGESFNRMIVSTNLDVESKESIEFINDLENNLKENSADSYVLGETALAKDMKDIFGNELLFITILTAISMIVIIALTFKSISIPLILVILIQTAIWLSMCIPVITDSPLFFFAYIIVQCIQMGATIDYAILLTSSYVDNRKKYDKHIAIENSLKSSVLTIFTSSVILVIAAFTIAFVSSQELISNICIVIGRGTIVSAVVVVFVLPACLIFFDKFIKKTNFKYKRKKDLNK